MRDFVRFRIQAERRRFLDFIAFVGGFWLVLVSELVLGD